MKVDEKGSEGPDGGNRNRSPTPLTDAARYQTVNSNMGNGVDSPDGKSRIHRLFGAVLGTPGKRVHAVIVVISLLYLAVHAYWGARLIDMQAPFTGFLLTITVAVAIGNVLVAVPVWVIAVLCLFRGPKPLAALPAPVPDERLPQVIVQLPGRNEPFKEVRRSIDSVLAANYPSDKLRIQFIDNSDDTRYERVSEHYKDEPRVSVEHRDGTKGFKGGNLNIGLERLGTFEDPSQVLIGLLDVGDTFAPEVVLPMATEFVHDERLAFVQDMFRTGNPRDTIINWSDSYVGDAARRFTEGYIAHYGIPTMNGHCALLRLSALEDTGRWNESRVAEDWSTGISMLSKGYHGKWVDYEPNNPDMVSTELVPGEIHAQQKQKRRWATGGTELAKIHLWEWMQSNLPWNQRLSLFFRLGANFSVLPGFIVQLLFPIWFALALLGEGTKEVLSFGLISAIVQNPFLLANTVAAVNYAREGRKRIAGILLVAYPIQALWRLPLFAHAGLGIAEGMSKGLKEFVITPKKSEPTSFMDILKSQRLVLGASYLSLLPLLAITWLRPDRVDALVIAALALPILTMAALFLVPMTQWLRMRRRLRRNPMAVVEVESD